MKQNPAQNVHLLFSDRKWFKTGPPIQDSPKQVGHSYLTPTAVQEPNPSQLTCTFLRHTKDGIQEVAKRARQASFATLWSALKQKAEIKVSVSVGNGRLRAVRHRLYFERSECNELCM